MPTTLPKKGQEFGVTIEFQFVNIATTFFDEKTKDANGPSTGVHPDFKILKCFESIFV